MFVTLLCYNAHSQSADVDPGKDTRSRFFAGISYSYFSFETEAKSLSYHSVWYGQDLGTISLNDEELDQINDRTTEKNYLHQVALEPGMVFLNKSNWYFDGKLLLGISRVKYKTTVDQPKVNHKEVTSEFNDPVGGLSLNLRYNFSERWGLTLVPHFTYSWGKAENIIDSITAFVSYFENDLKETYSLGYCRLNLMASYIMDHVMISAGPGVYYSFISKSYSIDRTDPESLNKYLDQIESTLSTFAYIDGCVRADWTIIDPLTLSVEAAVGKDLFVKTGLRYNF